MLDIENLWLRVRVVIVDIGHLLTTGLQTIIPKLIVVISLLFIGWLVALFLSFIIKKCGRTVGRFLPAMAKNSIKNDDSQTTVHLLAKTIYGLTWLFFIALSFNVLQWTSLQNVLTTIASQLPAIVIGFIIIFAGFLLGKLIKPLVEKAALSVNIVQAPLLGKLAQGTLVFFAIMMGAEYMGMHLEFIMQLAIVIIAIFFAGMALAFSLGAKTLMANVIGCQCLQKYCRLGQTLTINEHKGILRAIYTSTFVLEKDKKTHQVFPGKIAQEAIILQQVTSDEHA